MKWKYVFHFDFLCSGQTPGVYYSYPVVCANGDYKIVEGLPLSKHSIEKMKVTYVKTNFISFLFFFSNVESLCRNDELVSERDIVRTVMPDIPHRS